MTNYCKNTLPPIPHPSPYYPMLFLRDGKEPDQPRAVYLLNDDMEAMLDRQMRVCLREHGYPTGERAEIIKDMAFMRAKRLLMEQAVRQLWLLLIRGAVLALGALLLLGLQEYMK